MGRGNCIFFLLEGGIKMEKEEVAKQEKEIENDDKEIEEELEYSFEVGV